MPNAPFDAESELCRACELCCNSGLFTHVKLTDDDRAALASAGIDAPTRIEQPCGFRDGFCTVYQHRPQTCRDYDCLVLERTKDGELDYPQALALVEKALAMRARFVEEIGDARTLNEAVLAWFAAEPDARDPRRTETMLSYVAFRMFVEKHFLPPQRHWALSPSVEQEREASPRSESDPPVPSP